MRMDENLKNKFHKGILNEDNDTDDSEQYKGVAKNYKNLKTALHNYTLRNSARKRLAENAERTQSQKKRIVQLTKKNSIENDQKNLILHLFYRKLI